MEKESAKGWFSKIAGVEVAGMTTLHRQAQQSGKAFYKEINPVIRGWENYYRKAHVRKLFNKL